MSAAFVQGRANYPADAASATPTKTVSFAGNTTIGNLVIIQFYCTYSSTRGNFTVQGSDGTFLTRVAGASIQGVLFGSLFDVHTFVGPNYPAAITTFTIDTDQADFGAGGAVLQEWSGMALTSPTDGDANASQAAVGTGTDAMSSGNCEATSQANDVNIAFCYNDDTPIPTAGTGFTNVGGLGATALAAAIKGEYRTGLTNAQTVAGTFTHSSTADTITVSVNLKEASGTTITPGTGSLSLSGNAPVLAASGLRVPLTGALAIAGIAALVTQGTMRVPVVGALSLTGVAPVVTQGIPRIPVAGALALTGNAPVVTQGTVRVPVAGALSLTGIAPVINSGGSSSITPATGSLTFAGVAPSLTLGVPAPPTGALALTGIAPTVTLGDMRVSTVGALALTGFAPVVTQQFNRIPLTGTLTLTGNQPAPLGGNTSITPGTGSLTLTGIAPSAFSPITILPGTGTLTINGSAPSLLTSSPVITPGTGALAFNGLAPVVLNSGGGSTPGIGGLGISNPLVGISGSGIGGLGIS